MEFYISRAFEIGRLTQEQIEKLHIEENKTFPVRRVLQGGYEAGTYILKKALFPFEIEELFHLRPYILHYNFPPKKKDQEKLIQKTKKRLRQLRIAPEYDFLILDVDSIHNFDRAVSYASTERRLKLAA